MVKLESYYFLALLNGYEPTPRMDNIVSSFTGPDVGLYIKPYYCELFL